MFTKGLFWGEIISFRQACIAVLLTHYLICQYSAKKLPDKFQMLPYLTDPFPSK